MGRMFTWISVPSFFVLVAYILVAPFYTKPAVSISIPVAGVSEQKALAVVVPNPLPGIPAVPDHIKNHPLGDTTAIIKESAWITFWNFVKNGGQPPYCAVRVIDGTLLYAAWDLTVKKVTGGVYEGVAVILNGSGTTAMAGFDKGNDGKPKQDRWNNDFIPIKCPPPGNILQLAL